MKKFLSLLFFCSFLVSSLQAQQLKWVVKGKNVSDDIVLKPQQYLDGELNYDNLFISGTEASEIIAPADGTILSVGLDRMNTLQNSTYYGLSGSFNASINKLAKEKLPLPLKYINGSVQIKLANGNKLNINGLRGDKIWKTGMKIKQGEVLGTMGYAYKKVQKPCIALAISNPQNRADDPMKPFGLVSTFKLAKETPRPATLTLAQTKEDFDILMKSLKECYPSYKERITPEKEAAFIEQTTKQFKEGMKYETFYHIVRTAFTRQFINDSHINVNTPFPYKEKKVIYIPHLSVGVENGKLIATRAIKGTERYLRKEIKSIDSRSAEQIIKEMYNHVELCDEEVKSYVELKVFMDFTNAYWNRMKPQTNTITFADGTTYKDTWVPNNTVKDIIPKPLLSKYFRAWAIPKQKDFNFQRIDNNTALLTLSSFTLNEVELEEIATTLKANINVPHLIIDVRNNYGGDIKVLNKILSWFVAKPFCLPKAYDVVNSNSTYKSFKYCMNYPLDNKLFEGYEPYGDQFKISHETDTIQPNPELNYKGNIYVLINENSCSAATSFPASLAYEGRATIIGRETRTGYHSMNAEKFAQFKLPNSKITYTIPLVKIVFDETITNRFPAHRGLLPDIEVPISYDEVFIGKEDFIMNKALEIIKTK